MERRPYYDCNSHGTESYWQHPLGFLYTDGVQQFCLDQDAFWTLDVIGSYMPTLRRYAFMLILFEVAGTRCVFHAREDDDMDDVIRQDIQFTDLSLSAKMFLTDGVLLFPSEY